MPVPDDPALLADVEHRASAAATSWSAGAVLRNVRPLTGGTSSLTYLADLDGVPGEDQIVLKVAPPGLAPTRNRDVLRQGRLMHALHGQPGVRVPPVFFTDAGAPVDVPPLIAMGFIPGVCEEPYLSAERPPAGFPAVRTSAFECIEVMAAIHRLDPASIGLGAEPVVTLIDEIARWTRAFGTLPDDLAGKYEATETALLATLPPPLPPVINHGDFRVGNTLVEDGHVRAVIDWEIWSVGDPRIDMTWMTYFCDDARHPAAPNLEPSGMPSSAELEAAYQEARGVQLPDLAWFHALTRYKEAAATGLLIKRARKLGSSHESFARMEPALPSLLEEAHQLLDV